MKLWFLLLYNATFNSENLCIMRFTCFLSSLYYKYEHKLQIYIYEPCGWNVNWKYKINMIVKIHKAIRGNTVVWKILLVKGNRRLAMCGRRNNVDVKLFRRKKISKFEAVKQCFEHHIWTPWLLIQQTSTDSLTTILHLDPSRYAMRPSCLLSRETYAC